MGEFGQKLRNATGILVVILLVLKIIMLVTGNAHHMVSAGYPPPDLSVPEPKTEAEKQAAEERDKSFADFMSAVHQAQGVNK